MILADDENRNMNLGLSDPKHEDEDDDYLLPFGKISQRARRFDELESQKCNQTCKEDDNNLSQDLFPSQIEIPPSDTIERLSRYSPSSVLNTKTKTDTTAHFLELPPTEANGQQALISGYQGVKVCRGERISSVTQSNTFEALPHPTKLFRRRKQNYGQQVSVTKASQRSLRVQQQDNQSVAIHLRQLRLKQSRIDANKESDQTDLTESVTNSSTAAMTPRTMTETPSTTTSISDWEAIESWIHGRWKSQSGQHLNRLVEEE